MSRLADWWRERRRCAATLYRGRKLRCVRYPEHFGPHAAPKDPGVPYRKARWLPSFDLIWWWGRPGAQEPSGPYLEPMDPGSPDRRSSGEIGANPGTVAPYARRDDAAYGDWVDS